MHMNVCCSSGSILDIRLQANRHTRLTRGNCIWRLFKLLYKFSVASEAQPTQNPTQ